MTTGFPKSHRQARAEAFRLALAGVRQPAFAIDVQAAEIIAANADGAEALGLFSYADYPVAIDGAMPALQRLREIAASGTSADVREPLVFWFVGKPHNLMCRIARDTVMTDAGVMLVQVLEKLMPPANDTTTENAAPAIAAAASAKTGAPPPRTDAETLREIARRIREGFLPENPTLPSTVAEPEPAVPPPANPPVQASDPRKDRFPRRAALPALSPEDLAKLAHELKTPLSAIAAASEIMRDERLGPMADERYRGYAADIHESAAHALNVISAFLQPGASEPGGKSARETIDLNALAERVVSTMQPLAAERALRLAFTAGKGRPSVIADPTALRQILLNLLTNALKFTPRGGDVRTVTGFLDDGRVYLVVRDTGRGLAETGQNESTGSTTADTRLGKGAGIGLPLVRRLVEDMGAQMEIDSVPGKGTVVLIAFGAPLR